MNYYGRHGVYQSAFKQFHSVKSALLGLKNDFLLRLDTGDSIYLLLLDLSAAFDTVDHDLLLAVLARRIGFTECAPSWFRSYLKDRRQKIVTVRDINE